VARISPNYVSLALAKLESSPSLSCVMVQARSEAVSCVISKFWKEALLC